MKLKNAGQITYSELAAYVAMTGDSLSAFDVDAIRAIDTAYSGACQHG